MQDTVGAVPAACRVRDGGAGKITALFSMFTPRGRARDMHQSETIAGFFTRSMTVFLESDREKVFESIENSLDEVPGLIFRAVAGQMQEKAFADGEKVDAAEVFRAVNGSALPQKQKRTHRCCA